MDRFLDEHESPAALDRVSLPAVTAADSEQQGSGFTADDNKSSSQICPDSKPVVLDEGGGDIKPYASNGDSLTVATSDSVAVSSASDLSVGEAVASVDVSVKLCADAATDLQNADTAAGGTLHSADSCINVAGNSVETSKFASVLPSLCPTVPDDEIGNSQTEKTESEKVNTAETVSAADVLQTVRSSSDVDGVTSEPSQAAASSSATTVDTPYDQQCFGDIRAVSDSQCPTDSDVDDDGSRATPASVVLDTELSSRAVLRESDVGVGGAVDDVKPGDVERLLAAVDSATSAAGSLYSNVDPLTAALEFSSASVSADLLSSKASTKSAREQADDVTGGQETDDQVLESSLLPHSSNNVTLPVSCTTGFTSTSSLPPDCSDVSSADVLKQRDRSLSHKSVSATPDVTHDAGKDTEMATDEPPVAAVATSTSDVLAASQDVLLPHKPYVAHEQVSVSCTNENNSNVQLNNRNDDGHCPKETELASSSLNQLTESCYQSNNITGSLSCPDASNTQMDGTSALHAASVKTNSDAVSCSLTSGDVTLGDQSCSLDDAGQSASTDSRSLLTEPSDADHTST